MDIQRRFGPNIVEMERRHQLSAGRFMEEFVLPAKPVILTGLTDGWLARTRWTLEFLKERFGEETARVTHGLDQAYGDRTPMQIRDYLRFVSEPNDDRPLYLASWTIHRTNGNSGLFRDYDVPEHFRPCWQSWIPLFDPHWEWIFVGKKGVRLGLHLDKGWSSAWNAVITGKKEVIAYPYEELAKVSEGNSPRTFVDAFAPDEARFPDFRKAHGFYGELNPGELIFIPSKWIHQFDNVETGISVTHNWINHANWRYCDQWIAQHPVIGRTRRFVYRAVLRLFAATACIFT